VQIHGWDKSDFAVKYAQSQATRVGADVRFFQRDVLAAGWDDTYDVVVSSLFLHHFNDQAIVNLLKRMRASARRLVLASDLLRSSAGLVLAVVGTRVLSASPTVRSDGPLSVRRAFTRPEIHMLAKRAGMEEARIAWRWPFRFLLSWMPIHDATAV
jgi:2-polyprenyl-3-methyl-5-hydroxy-6-metoxy-1,4-benzoquinol methylase